MWGGRGVIYFDVFEGGNKAIVDKKKQKYIFLKKYSFFNIHIFFLGGSKKKTFLYIQIYIYIYLNISFWGGGAQKKYSNNIYICVYKYFWGVQKKSTPPRKKYKYIFDENIYIYIFFVFFRPPLRKRINIYFRISKKYENM